MTDRETAGLRGPVKVCSTEHDVAYPDHHWISYTDDVYSPEGNLLEKLQRNPTGSRWSIVCRYDEHGRLQEKRHSGDVTGAEREEFSYHYDAASRLERVMRRSDKHGERLFEFFQYALGGPKRESLYPAPLPDNGCGFMLDVSSGTVFTMMLFDRAGRPATKVLYDADDRVIRRIALRYDSRERLVKEGEIINGRIREDFRNIFQYDESGRMIEADRKWGDWGGERRTLTYNEYGDLTEVRIESACRLKGSGVECWAERSRFQYDEHQNWTVRITDTVRSSGEITVSATDRRTLVYY
jgi:hypothetical protein